MAARISITHGKDHEAIDVLREACTHDPGSLSVYQMNVECHARCNARKQRLISEQNRQKNSAQRKLDGKFCCSPIP